MRLLVAWVCMEMGTIGLEGYGITNLMRTYTYELGICV